MLELDFIADEDAYVVYTEDADLETVADALEKSGFNELLGKENICPNINVALEKAKAIIDVQEAEDKLRKTDEYKDLEFKKEVLRQYEKTEEEMKNAIMV